MKTLLFISHRISPALTGGEKYNVALLEGANRAGMCVQILAGNDIKPTFFKSMLVVNFYYLFKVLTTSKNTALLIDSDYHARIFLAVLFGKFFRKLPIIFIMFHYSYWDKKNASIRRLHYLIEQILSKTADVLLTISEYSKSNFNVLYPNNNTPFFIHRPFCKDSADSPLYPCNYSDTIRLIHVGSIQPRKNIHSVSESSHHLERPVSFDIIGTITSNHYLKKLTDTIKKLPSNITVKIHGRLDERELFGIQQQANIFILVSVMEGYGMVYAEAMRYGLPIIASHCGAIPEIVINGENGFLCEPTNAEQISNAILSIHKKETWEKFSANNLAKYSSFADRETFVQESAAIFKQILHL